MSQEITLVPERPLRRRISKVIFLLICLPACLVCFYAFGVGQFQAYKMAQRLPLAAATPIQYRQLKATPKVAHNPYRRELRRGFQIGQAVARLEKALEASEASK